MNKGIENKSDKQKYRNAAMTFAKLSCANKKECEALSGQMASLRTIMNYNPLDFTNPTNAGCDFKPNREISINTLIIRYLFFCNKMSAKSIAKILDTEPRSVEKMYHGFMTRLTEQQILRLELFTNLEIEHLLNHAKAYFKTVFGFGDYYKDVYYPITVTLHDGNILTGEKQWFNLSWLSTRFKHIKNVIVFKSPDSYHEKNIFRGDYLLVSKYEQDLKFIENKIYLIQDKSGFLYLRFSECRISNGNYIRILVNPLNKDDIFLFSALPAGITIYGRVVMQTLFD